MLKRALRRPKAEDKEITVKVRRAFHFGAGQLFQWSKLNASENNIVPIELSRRHDVYQGQDDRFEKGTQNWSLLIAYQMRDHCYAII